MAIARRSGGNRGRDAGVEALEGRPRVGLQELLDDEADAPANGDQDTEPHHEPHRFSPPLILATCPKDDPFSPIRGEYALR